MQPLPRFITLVMSIAATAVFIVVTSASASDADTRNTLLGASAAPAINVYGSNSPLGSAFSVTVSATDGTQSQPVPVELIRSSNTTLNFARLAFAGTIKVTVRVPNATNYSMSPRRYGIATQVNTTAQTITFTLSNDDASPSYLNYGQSIRLIVHDHYGTGPKLFLFFDRQVDEPVRDGVTVFDAAQDFGITPGAANSAAAINAAIQSLSDRHLPGSATLYLPAGVFTTGSVMLKSDVTVYLSGKAILMRPSSVAVSGALVVFNGANNAHLRGPGIVNANLWNATEDNIVLMNGASNCSLEDVTLTGTGAWSVYILDSSDIVGANYKIINELTENSDGTDPDHSRRVTLTGVFAHTKDDAFAVKTSPGYSAASDSVTISNAVIWTQKSGLKVGSEVTQAIRNIRFADNQVVMADRGMAVYGNGSGVAGGSVDGVEFVRNTIEKIQNLTQGKLVEFQVQYFANAAPYATVRGLNVTDTFCYSASPNVSTVSGVSGTPIANVAFERFWIDDANLAVSSGQGNVSGYFTVGSNATNVSFANSAQTLAVGDEAVVEFALAAVSPNPARGIAAIEYAVSQETRLELAVIDIAGREVARLAGGMHAPGRYRVVWSAGATVAPGVYFVQLRGDRQIAVRRLVVER